MYTEAVPTITAYSLCVYINLYSMALFYMQNTLIINKIKKYAHVAI